MLSDTRPVWAEYGAFLKCESVSLPTIELVIVFPIRILRLTGSG